MRRPPIQSSRTVAVAVLLGVVVYTAPALAQQPGPGPGSEIGLLGVSLLVQAVFGALITLTVGGGWILLAEEYTERTTDRVLEQPGRTFLYGLAIAIATFVLAVLLVITIVGVVVAIPLFVALVVIAELGYLAVGRAVVDDWLAVLGVAVVAAAFAGGVPVLGGLVGFVLSCMAYGSVYLEYRADDEGDEQVTASGPSVPDGYSVDRQRESGTATSQSSSTGDTDTGGSDATGEPRETEVERSNRPADWNDESVSEWDWGLDDETEDDDAGTDSGEVDR